MNLIQILAIVPFTLTAIFSICPYGLAESFPRMPVILSQAQYNLTGQWELETGTFGPECFVSKDIKKFPVTFTQNGNEFTANGGTVIEGRGTSPANIGNGRLSGDRFESQSDVFNWIGTVSSDGNSIQGNVTCQMSGGGTGRGTLPFSMKRSTGAVQPAPNPNPPNNSGYNW